MRINTFKKISGRYGLLNLGIFATGWILHQQFNHISPELNNTGFCLMAMAKGSSFHAATGTTH